MEVTCSDLCFRTGVRKPEPLDQSQPKITQLQREGAGDGTQGCVSPSLCPFPLPSYFPQSGSLDLGWDSLNDFEGSASLSPVPVHIDGVDLGGGMRDRLYSISSFATECMDGA